MLFDRIHHLTFVVRDLENSIPHLQDGLGIESLIREDLPGRGVRTARFRAGDTWIVLVQPIADGEPQRFLLARGEGLFLISYEVPSLDAALAQLSSRGGTCLGAPRAGLAGWRMADIQSAAMPGVVTQLCEDPATAR